MHLRKIQRNQNNQTVLFKILYIFHYIPYKYHVHQRDSMEHFRDSVLMVSTCRLDPEANNANYHLK